MAATFHPIMGKVFVIAIAVAALLFSAGYAQEAPTPPAPSPPIYEYPPCETLGVPLPECQNWCNKIGFHGGYLKADVCCCNS